MLGCPCPGGLNPHQPPALSQGLQREGLASITHSCKGSHAPLEAAGPQSCRRRRRRRRRLQPLCSAGFGAGLTGPH